MLLKLTLSPQREDRARYVALVSYERVPSERVPNHAVGAIGRNPAATGDYVAGVWKLWDFFNGKLHNTAVRQLRRIPGIRPQGIREWPRKLDREAPEPESLRRARVMAARRVAHVDPAIAAVEPDWNAALQLRLDAEARARAVGTTSSAVSA